jgi:hypothetical protein
MHLDGRSLSRLGTARNPLYRWLAVLFPVAAVGSLFGQGYLAPPSGFQGAPAVPPMGNVTPTSSQRYSEVSSQTIEQINNQATDTAESNGQGTPAIAAGSAPTEATAPGTVAASMKALTSWGAVRVHLRASYQFLYATGVHSQPGNANNTYTHTLAPGVTVDFGPHLTADYSPGIRFFSEKGFHNTVDHALDVHGGFNYGDWNFGASQKLSITDEPQVETSSQVQQNDYNTSIFASCIVNEKVTVTTTAGINLLFNSGGTNMFVHGSGAPPSNLTDSQNYTGAETLDYKFNEYLTGGVMASAGYTEQQGGFRSLEQDFDGHFNWHPGVKFSVTGSGGFQYRSFLGTQVSGTWNPIYSASVAYQLKQQTALSFYASRSVNASIFTQQLSQNTDVGIGIQQRLLGKVHLSLGFGYTKTDYQSTATADLSTSRSDESLSYTVGVSVGFLKRFNFATFYEYIQNHSSQKGFSLDSSQAGMTLSWAY